MTQYKQLVKAKSHRHLFFILTVGLCISTGDQNPEVAITSSAFVKTFPLSRKRGRPKKEQSEGMEEAAGTEFEEQLVEQTLVFPEVPAEVRSGKKRSGARKKSRECDVCNKVFANRSSLREHQRMHSGEKPYICSICDKGFIRMGHLRQHMCSHTGLWPFKCGACGKGNCFFLFLNCFGYQTI